jgi:hypothetical protein
MKQIFEIKYNSGRTSDPVIQWLRIRTENQNNKFCEGQEIFFVEFLTIFPNDMSVSLFIRPSTFDVMVNPLTF